MCTKPIKCVSGCGGMVLHSNEVMSHRQERPEDALRREEEGEEEEETLTPSTDNNYTRHVDIVVIDRPFTGSARFGGLVTIS